jgi:hypothetical protein
MSSASRHPEPRRRRRIDVYADVRFDIDPSLRLAADVGVVHRSFAVFAAQDDV